MTDLEKEIALALRTVRQYGFKAEFEFVKSMAQRAELNQAEPLPERQSMYLAELLHKYRYQLPELHKAHCNDPKCRAKEFAKAIQFSLF